MALQEKIKKDLTQAMKDKDTVRKDALRVILGEFGRAETKALSDNDIIKILKKLLKSEREMLEKKGAESDSEFVRIVEAYLPQMATEEEIGKLFNDCEIGAVPAIGKPYGVDMIWDEDLATLPDVYMESGDHEILVHVAGEDFKHLVDDQKHGHISTHM